MDFSLRASRRKTLNLDDSRVLSSQGSILLFFFFFKAVSWASMLDDILAWAKFYLPVHIACNLLLFSQTPNDSTRCVLKITPTDQS